MAFNRTSRLPALHRYQFQASVAELAVVAISSSQRRRLLLNTSADTASELVAAFYNSLNPLTSAASCNIFGCAFNGCPLSLWGLPLQYCTQCRPGFGNSSNGACQPLSIEYNVFSYVAAMSTDNWGGVYNYNCPTGTYLKATAAAIGADWKCEACATGTACTGTAANANVPLGLAGPSLPPPSPSPLPSPSPQPFDPLCFFFSICGSSTPPPAVNATAGPSSPPPSNSSAAPPSNSSSVLGAPPFNLTALLELPPSAFNASNLPSWLYSLFNVSSVDLNVTFPPAAPSTNFTAVVDSTGPLPPWLYGLLNNSSAAGLNSSSTNSTAAVVQAFSDGVLSYYNAATGASGAKASPPSNSGGFDSTIKSNPGVLGVGIAIGVVGLIMVAVLVYAVRRYLTLPGQAVESSGSSGGAAIPVADGRALARVYFNRGLREAHGGPRGPRAPDLEANADIPRPPPQLENEPTSVDGIDVVIGVPKS